MKTLLFALSVLLVFKQSNAHEGHSMPGALPPAPHGGVVQEAEHTGKNVHADGKEEDELFFEAVYKDKSLRLFPLILTPQNTAVFGKLAPSELTQVEAKVDFPRSKKSELITLKAQGEGFETAFDAKGNSRFIVLVSAMHNKEAKKSKLQVEVK